VVCEDDSNEKLGVTDAIRNKEKGHRDLILTSNHLQVSFQSIKLGIANVHYGAFSGNT
jgi:hypothetical protein